MDSLIKKYAPKEQKAKGQSLIIVVLCMVVLIVMVGLAVDGGLLYGERRTAQNASDSMALAGAQKMLDIYENMLVTSYPLVPNGSAQDEAQVLSAVQNYTTRNKAKVSEAFFVNDNKQIVSVALNSNATPPCGTSLNKPCQVGKNGSIPWNSGAKGIEVKSEANTDSFFMSMIGFKKLTADAQSTGFMGRAIGVPNVDVFPVGVFTNANGIDNLLNTLVGGRIYVLAQVDSRVNVGSWGNLEYNGESDPDVRSKWFECGYNPILRSDADWDRACPGESNGNSHAWGPTVYWTGAGAPTQGPNTAYDLMSGSGTDGWWIGGTIGSTRDSCLNLSQLINNLEVGRRYLIPIIDAYDGGTGNDRRAKFHLVDLAWFNVIRVEVNCHVPNDILNPLAGEHQTWVMIAQYLYAYSAGSGGQHANLTNTSRHTVFLEP